jgi:hypothetical protein
VHVQRSSTTEEQKESPSSKLLSAEAPDSWTGPRVKVEISLPL